MHAHLLVDGVCVRFDRRLRNEKLLADVIHAMALRQDREDFLLARGEFVLLDVISGVKVANPEDMIISREEFSDIESKMNDILSDLEWKVLMSYLDGKSYQEIAAELGRHIKSIDNALQRVKRKLEKYIISKGDITDLRTVYSGLLAIDPYERFKNKNS